MPESQIFYALAVLIWGASDWCAPHMPRLTARLTQMKHPPSQTPFGKQYVSETLTKGRSTQFKRGAFCVRLSFFLRNQIFSMVSLKS